MVPSIQGPFNAAAEFDTNAMAEGPVGTILGRPWYVDANIPLTRGGGTTNPSMASVSAGHTSPTDGSGSGDNFTPFLAGVWDDILLFEGDIRSRRCYAGNLCPARCRSGSRCTATWRS